MKKTIVIFLTVLPSFAFAGQWVICDYSIKVKAITPPELRAEVLTAAAKNPENCLKPGAELSFMPESEDYQSHLPQKAWPKKGQRAKLRYRELSGICKNDGNPQPCTIVHYSIIKAKEK